MILIIFSCANWSFENIFGELSNQVFGSFLSWVVVGFLVYFGGVESSMHLYSELQIIRNFSETLRSSFMFIIRT